MKRLIVNLFAVLGGVLLLAGCSTSDNKNNYLKPEDFAAALTRAGVKIERANRLDPAPLNATEAIELKIAGSGIGVYKFDRAIRISRDRLERIKKSKKIYFNCIPYPIYEVHGSFIVVGLDKNPEKHRILEVLRNFR